MTNYEELVKALRHCGKDLMPGERCKDSCPYGDIALCLPKLKLDAAAAIEALMDAEKTYLAELAQCHENLRRAAETRRERDERIEALQAEVERLKADVDAAYRH